MTPYTDGIRYNLQANLFGHLRRDRIDTTSTIHNNFSILSFYLSVCVEDDSSSPVILLLRLWECTSNDIYAIWRCELNTVTFNIITFLIIIRIVVSVYVWVICNFLVIRLGSWYGNSVNESDLHFTRTVSGNVTVTLTSIILSGALNLKEVCSEGLLRSSLCFPLKSFFQEETYWTGKRGGPSHTPFWIETPSVVVRPKRI